MKERYKFLKMLYPNYLIGLMKKGNIFYLNDDQKMIDIFGNHIIHKVNYLIVDNMDIIKIVERKNNRYVEYLIKTKIITILNDFQRSISEEKRTFRDN